MVHDLVRLWPAYDPVSVLQAPATILQASDWGLAAEAEEVGHGQ